MLELSTRSRYAVRILALIAARHPETVTTRDIASVESISRNYAEQILMKMRKASLVTSRRGVKGGFRLACPSSEITVARILHAMEGRIAIAPCIKAGCKRAVLCSTHGLWQDATDAVNRVFENTTIERMIKKASINQHREKRT